MVLFARVFLRCENFQGNGKPFSLSRPMLRKPTEKPQHSVDLHMILCQLLGFCKMCNSIVICNHGN